MMTVWFRQQRWVMMWAVLFTALFMVGCSTPTTTSPSSSETLSTAAATSASETTADSTPAETGTITEQSSNDMSDLPRLNGKATVVMTVNDQPITIAIDGDKAPITAGNFVDLVQRGVYDNLVFHRVVTQPQPFVAQGGDPQGKDPNFPASRLGTGSFVDPDTGKPRYIPLEITPAGASEPTYSTVLSGATGPELKHTRGAIAMARSQMPDSASAQFYFALDDLSFLDGSYAVFGQVTEGMDVVDGIEQGDRIQTATVTEGLENLQQP
ncbi:peptidylprolyl isomerase [Spirulina major CS-329]|nr:MULTISPECIES: peptidylprolyl isomerase [Spirulina]MDB9502625.1 peptidylprolyl isomerase [Spirulina major CS-329]